MADTTITIPDLGSLTAGQASDLLLATRGTTGYKMLLSDLAKYMVETYNSSSLAGSAQSVKNALDSLNSRCVIAVIPTTTSGINQCATILDYLTDNYPSTGLFGCIAVQTIGRFSFVGGFYGGAYALGSFIIASGVNLFVCDVTAKKTYSVRQITLQ